MFRIPVPQKKINISYSSVTILKFPQALFVTHLASKPHVRRKSVWETKCLQSNLKRVSMKKNVWKPDMFVHRTVQHPRRGKISKLFTFSNKLKKHFDVESQNLLRRIVWQ